MYTSIFEGTIVTDNWLDVQKAGKEKRPVLFPIGVIEEHGPHIPLGSDIYWSYAMCRMVKDKLKSMGKEAVIAPPYYWGVNFCTGGFPGSFSLKPETMKQVLVELLENLKAYGFEEVYCFNYHGDATHIGAIVEAIQFARAELFMNCKLVLEAMDLELHGWEETEEFLLVTNPPYPMECLQSRSLRKQVFWTFMREPLKLQ